MFDFNDPKYTDPSTGNFTWQGSINAGQDQASRGYALTPQMQNETWVSYETRHNAYHDSLKGNY